MPYSFKESEILLRFVEYRKIVRKMTGGVALALALALVASSASAQTPASISVLGAGLSTTSAGVTCPNGTDNCARNTISGPITKIISSYPGCATHQEAECYGPSIDGAASMCARNTSRLSPISFSYFSMSPGHAARSISR